MKTQLQAYQDELFHFNERIIMIEWYFTIIKNVKLKEEGCFWLFDGDTYTKCICLSLHDDDYRITYADKKEDTDFYHDTECYDLKSTMDLGCDILPFDEHQENK